MEKIFQNVHVRLMFSIPYAMKAKVFVAREIQYFDLGIFLLHVFYYLTRGFVT